MGVMKKEYESKDVERELNKCFGYYIKKDGENIIVSNNIVYIMTFSLVSYPQYDRKYFQQTKWGRKYFLNVLRTISKMANDMKIECDAYKRILDDQIHYDEEEIKDTKDKICMNIVKIDLLCKLSKSVLDTKKRVKYVN
jgi:hypothetical protein